MQRVQPSILLLCWGTRRRLGLGGCVESYLPDVLNSPTQYLVVDGFINGNGATRIKLSRSVTIGAAGTPPAEKGARVTLADDAGRSYSLPERSAGFYQSDSLLLPTNRRYELRITTAGRGREVASYASDLVPLKVTPAIDRLTWHLEGDQVVVQLSTQDASAQTRYYRWGGVETWKFHSAYQSSLEYRNGIIDTRIMPIYTCWRTENSTATRQASTSSLSQDALVDHDLVTFPSLAERVKTRYSVLVSQAGETAEEFAYREILRKNTEAVGTVNDPLPSQLTGNGHRVDNAAEPALGFVGGHTVRYKRLFINRSELLAHHDWNFESPYTSCNLGEENLAEEHTAYPHTLIFDTPDNVPVEKLGTAVTPYGYPGSSRFCVDCRVRGTNVKPSFW